MQIWGLFAVWSESNGGIMKDKGSDGYRQWWLIANFMLSIRVMFYAVILLTFTIFACLICCQRQGQAFEEQAQLNRREARLPQVKEYLTSRKEVYKKREGCTEEDGKEECAICLGEFTEDAKEFVVVLDCGSASTKSIQQQQNENQSSLSNNNNADGGNDGIWPSVLKEEDLRVETTPARPQGKLDFGPAGLDQTLGMSGSISLGDKT